MRAGFSYLPRNLRDLSGLKGRRGVLRPGLLFRAANLDRPTAEECEMLRRLGITLALDLRDEKEKAPQEQRLSALLPEVTTRDFPLLGHLSAEEKQVMRHQLHHIRSLKELRGLMAQQYAMMLTRGRPAALRALNCVMGHEGPLIFFCMVGKDRTGVFAMLLLLILGVDLKEIFRDYDRTNRRVFGLPFLRRNSPLARRQYAGNKVPPMAIHTLADAHRDFLAGALQVITDAGGIDAWLSGPDGIDPALIADFRARLLIP